MPAVVRKLSDDGRRLINAGNEKNVAYEQKKKKKKVELCARVVRRGSSSLAVFFFHDDSVFFFFFERKTQSQRGNLMNNEVQSNRVSLTNYGTIRRASQIIKKK